MERQGDSKSKLEAAPRRGCVKNSQDVIVKVGKLIHKMFLYSLLI